MYTRLCTTDAGRFAKHYRAYAEAARRLFAGIPGLRFVDACVSCEKDDAVCRVRETSETAKRVVAVDVTPDGEGLQARIVMDIPSQWALSADERAVALSGCQ